MSEAQGIAAGRLTAAAYEDNFSDLQPRLDRRHALVDASRCYFCHDAPCVEACPTGIDIPGFIRKISTDNVRGAGVDILSENIFGGACARVCPVEILCERACVRTAQEGKPVAIGRLQRHATDWLMEAGDLPFGRAAATGHRVAVVGAGPAGLSCAHGLARQGHEVTVFEAREKAAGLNEYGVAAYKVAGDFARRELAFILSLGGIEVLTGRALGRDVELAGLRRDFDAVFLGIGLGSAGKLGIEGEGLDGVHDAVDYIALLRQAPDLSRLAVGRRVVVIGGGNTAIDIAVQSKRLGAEDVSLVYRRGAEAMGATGHEQDFARTNGVAIKHWARPMRILGPDGAVTGVEFERTATGGSGGLAGTGETFTIEADMVFKAIGQALRPDALDPGGGEALEMAGRRIAVDAERATSLAGLWAGGDCIPGDDLTVAAVQDGKLAAASIDRFLKDSGKGGTNG
jgi:glutamate synthase (NADPH/NADH) small chain